MMKITCTATYTAFIHADLPSTNDIQVFDLHEDFSESGESPGFYASDTWHPNSRGHWFIARQLLPSVPLE